MFSLGQILTILVLTIFGSGFVLSLFCEGKKRYQRLAGWAVFLIIVGLLGLIALANAFAWFHLAEA